MSVAGVSGFSSFHRSMMDCSMSFELPGWLDQNWRVPSPSSPPPPLPAEVEPPAQAPSASAAEPAPAMPRSERRENVMSNSNSWVVRRGGAADGTAGTGTGTAGRGRSALDGPGGEALDHLLLQDQEDDEHGDRGQDGAGHHRPPVGQPLVVLQLRE